jgi:hypothetical protein
VTPHRQNPVIVGPGGLHYAIDSIGANRLLFGTDFARENQVSLLRVIDNDNEIHIDPSAAHAVLD